MPSHSRAISFLAELEEKMRAGDIQNVQSGLRSINKSDLHRENAARASALARRAGLPELTLRWLKPYVYPKTKALGEATAEERAEYAMGLIRFAALEEAQALLQQAQGFPALHFYQALADLGSWNYASALENLDAFLQSSGERDRYQEQIARVNRLACRIGLEDFERAEEESAALSAELRQNQRSLLLANTLELSAQLAVQKKAFAQARTLLEEADRLLTQAPFLDRLLIRKWSVIASTLESGRREDLQTFRAEALALNHWETLRDLDYYQWRIQPEEKLGQWLYYGTPYSYFRERLVRHGFTVPVGDAWVSREPTPDKLDPFNVSSSFGEVAHVFILLLNSDFYRPLRLGEIFSRLFRDQVFDLQISANRVQKIVRSAREFIAEVGWPARIEEAEGQYGLRWSRTVAIRCQSQPWPTTREGLMIHRLRSLLPTHEFTAQQAASLFQLSKPQTARWLQRAVDMELVLRLGAGKNTYYRFK